MPLGIGILSSMAEPHPPGRSGRPAWRPGPSWLARALVFHSLRLASCDTRPCASDVRHLLSDVYQWNGRTTSYSGSLSSCNCVLDASTGFTPLHEVSLRGGPYAAGLVHVFVRHYASLTATDARDSTALHLAAGSGALGAARALCDSAAGSGDLSSLAALDVDGRAPLDIALDAWELGIARLLVERRAVLEPDPGLRECAMPLLEAVVLGEAARVAAALAAPGPAVGSAEVNCTVPPAQRRRTLLHLAAGVSDLSRASVAGVAELLLARGANATAPDAAGWTPLALAARGGRTDVVAALLNATPPARLDSQDAHGRTALHLAAAAGAQGSTALLLQAGSSANLRDRSGRTAFDHAREQGHEAVMAAISAAGSLAPAGAPAAEARAPSQNLLAAGRSSSEEDDKGSAAPIIGAAAAAAGGALLCMASCCCLRRWLRRARSFSVVAAMPGGPAKDRGPRKAAATVWVDSSASPLSDAGSAEGVRAAGCAAKPADGVPVPPIVVHLPRRSSGKALSVGPASEAPVATGPARPEAAAVQRARSLPPEQRGGSAARGGPRAERGSEADRGSPPLALRNLGLAQGPAPRQVTVQAAATRARRRHAPGWQ